MLCGLAAWPVAAQAVELGMRDEFETGTTLGWTGGASPTCIPDGGPTGAGDGFLQISRPQFFPFHLGTKNEAQWSGDYLTAGIQAIEMDLNWIDGPDDLTVRILIIGPGGVWASTNVTPVTTGWHHYVFGLTADDLVYVTGSPIVPDGTGVLADTLAAVATLLIRHDFPEPTPPGLHPPHVSAVLGLDNICASPGPGCHCTQKGDWDFDRDVDLVDYAEIAACLDGPGIEPADPECGCGDFDADGDVDLEDFAEFQEMFIDP
jgi:hypothetical protein